MQIEIHADDLGASLGVNKNIFRCHDEGCLQSASLLVTTNAVDDAISGIKARPNLNLCLHLDLLEGHCRAPDSSVHLLVDELGFFNSSISELAKTFILGPTGKRRALVQQLSIELSAQFDYYFSHDVARQNRRVDSHLHTHTLPFIWPIVEKLCHHHGVTRVRLPHTVHYLDGFRTEQWWKRKTKALILTVLSRRQRNGLKHFLKPSHLITGVVSVQALQSLTPKLPHSEIVEVLFHPGCWSPQGDSTMRTTNRWKEVHSAYTRHLETQVLLSDEFATTLRQLRTQ